MGVTRRGWATVGVVLFCLAMAAQYGSRALNAVVVPLVIVFVAGVLTVYRADEPGIRRHPVHDGFVGERRDVRLTPDVSKPISATVRDRLGPGLDAADDRIATTLKPETPIEYEIHLAERAVHDVGPVSVTIGDLFGLVEREFRYDGKRRVVAYPEVYDLRGGARHDLRLLSEAVREGSREEFDHLREYARGDDLRDVHWKSAAKRTDDELVVKEFVADDAAGAATVAGEAPRGESDELASALASVAAYLLTLGVTVDVRVSEGDQTSVPSEDVPHDLYRLLAVTDAGRLDDRTRERADVLVRVTADDRALVVVDDHEIPFERLRGDSGGRPDVERDGRTGGHDAEVVS